MVNTVSNLHSHIVRSQYTTFSDQVLRSCCLASIVWLISVSLTFAEPNPAARTHQWPEFRGPQGNGLAHATELPWQWTESTVAWKQKIPGKGWSSPVVWGDQIWLTTATEDGKQMFALCIDRESGKIEREILVFENEEPKFCHPTNSYASPTPAIEAGRVYVHFGSYGTACLDTQTGNKLWERRDFECDHWRGPAASPILHDGRLHVAFDGYDVQYVVALNTNDGTTAWRVERDITYSTDNGDHRKAYCTNQVIDDGQRKQLISPSAEQTISYDPATGAEYWRVSHGGMNAATRPLYQHGLVFVTIGDSVGRTKPTLLAIRPGQDVSQEDRVAWKTDKSVPRRPSPVIVGERLFMIGDDGVATCLNAKTGDQIWRKRIPGSYRASPLVVGERIYFFSMEGKTTVIAAGDSYSVLAENELENGFQASPAVVGNTLLLRSTEHLYSIQ